MEFEVSRVYDCELKSGVVRTVLEGLPEWFGIEEAVIHYVEDSKEQIVFGAFDLYGNAIACICLKETSNVVLEVSVIGVNKDYQRKGIGKLLMSIAIKYAGDNCYRLLQVKTIELGHFVTYDQTNEFYKSQGFFEFEVFPSLWNPAHPCQIYTKII